MSEREISERMITVRVNDEQRRVTEGCTVADLLRELGLAPEVVAVEINRTLVPRRERAERRLAEGDRVELVTLVGGG